jgi:hypothetical protein
MAAMLLFPACSTAAAGVTSGPSPSATAEPAASVMQTPVSSVTPEPTPASTPMPTPSPAPEPTPTPTGTPVVHEDGPQIIGIYLPSDGHQALLTEYNEKWVKGIDIATFHAVATNDKKVGSSTSGVFLAYWNKFENAKQFKVGYILSFTLKSGEIVKLTIRGPKDAPKDPSKNFYQYVEVYMYDAVHQIGRHSHLTAMKPDTFLTSIKLTAGSKIEEVQSIRLTAFVYKDDSDFDPVTGEYIGGVSYTIPINNGSRE